MRWADLDIERKLWILPPEATKAGRTHEVPLSDLVLEIIKGAPRVGRVFVFPTRSHKGAERPPSGFSAAKRRADKAAGIDNWRVHDLRRTAATHTRALGIDRDTVSAILNHSPGDVTSIYDRYSALPEKRRALDAWSNKLRAIIEGKAENVVELVGAKS